MWAKKAAAIICIFIVSLSISYIGVSLWREDQFEKEYKRKYEEESSELKNMQSELSKKSFDFKNLDEIMEYANRRYRIDDAGYRILGIEFLINNSRSSIIQKLPGTYGKVNAIQIHWAASAVSYGFSNNCIIEIKDFINEKMQKETKVNDDWWYTFEKSSEFKEYLSNCTVYEEKYTEEDIDTIYQKIQNIEIPINPSIMQTFLQYWTLRTEKYIAEEAYNNYKEHLHQKEYISALVDKNVLIQAWFHIDLIAHTTTLHNYFYTLSNYALYYGVQKYFFIDLACLIVLTIVIFISLYIILMMVIKRYTS
jgi:hypothetical protein